MRTIRLRLLLVSGFALSCAGGPAAPGGPDARRPTPNWSYFEEPAVDIWSRKIDDWQARQREQGTSLAEREHPPLLHPADYALLLDRSDAFLVRERRALAARIATYSQKEARRHFRWDPETDLAGDPWPTSRELYARNGDDCDGLDLIAYDLLRAFGFPKSELFRAVIRRDHDGANHMATLWFEDREDPWLIDATGAISRRMRRLSDLRGWTPLRVFDEDELYGVEPR